MSLIKWNCPVTDILSAVVVTQAIRPLLICKRAAPRARFDRIECADYIQVRQICECVLAMDACEVLEEN